ncbi:hypothetical protein [Mesorhizobium hungaricum]|jgi:hypothetical protein|uniref:hypothetical protein n=1 Tax=Mesorhizobium TaxID=68287 RepID=UPI00139F2ADB|nr:MULTISPECIES: hypothetical protein [Mesorhizobium]MBN9236287.1 hypothetical protein [Mesorhizobium sp.]MDQ0327813.1 hypothetical protein [Mesorhizobium sp. YL-MeA3-2017]
MPGSAISRLASCTPVRRNNDPLNVMACSAISPLAVMIASHLCNALWRICNKTPDHKNLSAPHQPKFVCVVAKLATAGFRRDQFGRDPR